MLPVYTKLQSLRPAAVGAGQSLAAAVQQLLPSCAALQTTSIRNSSTTPTRPGGAAPGAGPGPRTRSFDQAAAAGETTDTAGRAQVLVVDATGYAQRAACGSLHLTLCSADVLHACSFRNLLQPCKCLYASTPYSGQQLARALVWQQLSLPQCID
ncbi:hypothetical protein COO60DRAFT_535507 [Scenedesmus sp. NREL 46B-D3]|nr:hypothetical protein COO60DRAFT_535507 [Scenedesmus sp. NREL 46B-D3]